MIFLFFQMTSFKRFYMHQSKSELKQQIDIPDEFLCPISTQIMSDPVLAEDGETYERIEIERYFAGKAAQKEAPQDSKKQGKDNNNSNNAAASKGPVEITSPLRSDMVIGTKLTPNLGILRQIKRFLESHPSVGEDLYFEETLIAEAFSAIDSHDMLALHRLIQKDKRLLTREIKDNKPLIDIVCAAGSVKMLSAVLTLLRKYGEPTCDNAEKLKERLLLCQQSMGDGVISAFLSAIEWSDGQISEFFKSQVIAGVNGLVGGFIRSNVIDVDEFLDDKKNAAAHMAVLHNQRSTLELLIQLGADVKQVNADNLNVKQLAQQKVGKQLVRDISQWRQNKKSEALLRRVDQLESENAKLKETVGSLQKELGGKADKTVLLSMSSQFFKSFVRKSMMPKGSIPSSDQANSDGIYPLVDAAHRGDYQAFYSIEQRLADPDALSCYVLMIDMKRVLKVIEDMIPEQRPEGATYAWIAQWYKNNADQPWRASYDDIDNGIEKMDWTQRGDFWFKFKGGHVIRKLKSHFYLRSEKAAGSGYMTTKTNECTTDTPVFLAQYALLKPESGWRSAEVKSDFMYEETTHDWEEMKEWDGGSLSYDRQKDGWYLNSISDGWGSSRQYICRKHPEKKKEVRYDKRMGLLCDPKQHDEFVSKLVNDLTMFKKHIMDLREQAQEKQSYNFSL